MRIVANSGVGKLGVSQVQDGASGFGELDGSTETGALLSGDETVALDAILVASIQDARTSADRPIASTRVEAKATVPSTAWAIADSTPALLASQATSRTPMNDVNAVQAEQGTSGTAPHGPIGGVTPSGWQPAVEAAQSTAMLKFVAAAVAASHPMAEARQAESLVASASGASVGDGHAGQRNSSSDEEQSKRSVQLTVTEATAATPEKLIPGWYLPPLFNRRLETNGVDDALLLATDAARREAMFRKHGKIVVVPPIQPVVHVVTNAPVVAESKKATMRSDFRTLPGGALAPEPLSTGDLETAETPVENAAITVAPPKRPVNRYKMRHRQVDDFVSRPLSDQRGFTAAERADCWVQANVPGGLIQRSRCSVRSPERILAGLIGIKFTTYNIPYVK